MSDWPPKTAYQEMSLAIIKTHVKQQVVSDVSIIEPAEIHRFSLTSMIESRHNEFVGSIGINGFKGFDFDETNELVSLNAYKYKLGQIYEHIGEIEPCVSGFHFCKYLPNVFEFYNPMPAYHHSAIRRYANITAYENIVSEDKKSVTNKIQINSFLNGEYTYNVTESNGDTYTFQAIFKNGFLHCEYGPALITNCSKSGKHTIVYFINGKCHRTDGPAVLSYFNNEIYKQNHYINGIYLS